MGIAITSGVIASLDSAQTPSDAATPDTSDLALIVPFAFPGDLHPRSYRPQTPKSLPRFRSFGSINRDYPEWQRRGGQES
jgi:hypothetical protein